MQVLKCWHVWLKSLTLFKRNPAAGKTHQKMGSDSKNIFLFLGRKSWLPPFSESLAVVESLALWSSQL